MPEKHYELLLKPIDLSRHSDTCVEFREDSFVQSFGSPDRFQRLGAEEYVRWLGSKIEAYPGSCCHLWLEDMIVGQLEVGGASHDSSLGWIFLVYVSPAWRRRGFGRYVLSQGEFFLKQYGFTRAGLRASRTNSAALQLYSVCDWTAIRADPDSEDTLVFEKAL